MTSDYQSQQLNSIDMAKNLYYNECIFSEWVVILGIRSESKQRTRELILKQTALLLDNKGFLNQILISPNL